MTTLPGCRQPSTSQVGPQDMCALSWGVMTTCCTCLDMHDVFLPNTSAHFNMINIFTRFFLNTLQLMHIMVTLMTMK